MNLITDVLALPSGYRASIKPEVLTVRLLSHNAIMYDEEYDNDFGMSDDELLYREMNSEDPWYMGPSEDNIYYDSDEIDIDQLDDWD